MREYNQTMMLVLIGLLSFLISCGIQDDGKLHNSGETRQTEANRTITDMAGRQVTIPLSIKKVYATHSIGTLFVYTLSPELVLGWNVALSDTEKNFIKEQYHDLPVLGRWKGTGSANTEQLLKAQPDIIINMGDLTPSYIAESDEIQDLLNIPVVMVDGSITEQAASYEFLGSLFDLNERANNLASYSRSVLDRIQSRANDITEADKATVYYGAGLDGLDTMPAGSINTEILDLAGGINVVDSGRNGTVSKMQVSMEQLLQWNPQFIILSTSSSHNKQLYHEIINDPRWLELDAVATKNVKVIPYGPYDWFSQPPTLLRILGMQWLGNLLYPQIHTMDMKSETKRFFKLFFSIELSTEQVTHLLEGY